MKQISRSRVTDVDERERDNSFAYWHKRDHLFRVSVDGLTLLEESHWPASPSLTQLCQDKGQTEENCHNFIRVLLQRGDQVLACGTNAFSPRCSWRQIEAIDVVDEWVNGMAKCPYSPHANITSLMTADGDYFIGAPTDFSGQDAAIYRLLGQSNRLRTMQYNSKWLNRPEFVGSFETEDFVYFFFREVAVEYINCGKVRFFTIVLFFVQSLAIGGLLIRSFRTVDY